jgi:hypothetical protein
MGMRDSAPQNRNIDLHIEEIIMEGFSPRDRSRIASVVQQQLQQLLNQGEIIQNRNTAHVDGGTIQIEPGASPEMAGRQIAQNLYRRLVK